MDFEVPENVEVHKQVQPKGLSYPLKTSEIVTDLNLGELDAKFSIFYMNNKPEPTRPRNQKHLRPDKERFNIFSLTWYGHTRESPHFFMGVHLVRPKYRQKVNKIVREEILPHVLRWLKDAVRLPYINGLSCDYHRLNDPTGSHHFEWGIELQENKERRLCAKVIDLDKKDEDENPTEEGPVLEA